MRTIFYFLLCLGLAACGTKPKELKGPQPFPASYPQQVGAPPTPAQNPPSHNTTPDK